MTTNIKGRFKFQNSQKQNCPAALCLESPGLANAKWSTEDIHGLALKWCRLAEGKN